MGFMGRRRSVIRQEINRILYGGNPRDYSIVYVDRGSGSSTLKELPANRVAMVSGWAILLDDMNTVIPLHRVVEVRRRDGEIVWRRGRS